MWGGTTCVMESSNNQQRLTASVWMQPWQAAAASITINSGLHMMIYVTIQLQVSGTHKQNVMDSKGSLRVHLERFSEPVAGPSKNTTGCKASVGGVPS